MAKKPAHFIIRSGSDHYEIALPDTTPDQRASLIDTFTLLARQAFETEPHPEPVSLAEFISEPQDVPEEEDFASMLSKEEEELLVRAKHILPQEEWIADQDDDHPENAFYLETGIKYKKRGLKWIPTYRVRYDCSKGNCNNKGNHYVAEGTRKVHCHTCSNEMTIRPAAKGGFPNTDEANNYYIAGKVPAI